MPLIRLRSLQGSAGIRVHSVLQRTFILIFLDFQYRPSRLHVTADILGRVQITFRTSQMPAASRHLPGRR